MYLFTSYYTKMLGEAFRSDSVEWKTVYVLPRIATIESSLHSVQYKILNNILYLNDRLFTFDVVKSPLPVPKKTILYQCCVHLNKDHKNCFSKSGLEKFIKSTKNTELSKEINLNVIAKYEVSYYKSFEHVVL